MLGIVTVTYNSIDVLEEFLSSVSGQSYSNYKLYIVDNDSKDGTLPALEVLSDPRVMVIANQNNLGIAEGNNIGIRAALADGCEYVLLINNDTAFAKDVFEILVEIADTHQVEALAPRVMFHDRQEAPWFSGGRFIKWRAFRNTHHLPATVASEDLRLLPIGYAPTCCMLIRKQVFDVIGFMDPAFFVYSDDCDFCWRMGKAGIQLYYTEATGILHKASSLTGGNESRFSLRYMMRNRVLFVRKHAGPILKAWSLLYLQIEIWYKLLFISHDFSSFRIQQRAYFEGLRA